jgi:hypothetical protein
MPPAEPTQTVRLREGDREAEISGSAAFVRQALDDLPSLFARLRGEAPAPTRPSSISMPPPPRAAVPHVEDEDEYDDEDEEDTEPPVRARRERHADERPGKTKAAPREEPPAKSARAGRSEAPASGRAATREDRTAAPAPRAAANGHDALEDRVFDLLENADRPLSVAAIRRELGGDTTGQQIRRILERAADRVISTDERPAAYTLR